MTDPSVWSARIGPVLTRLQAEHRYGAKIMSMAEEGGDLLALRTSDDVIVYPAYQFDDRGPVEGWHEVLAAFRDRTDVSWTVAAWANTPLAVLGSRSVADALSAHNKKEAVVAAYAAARRWAR
ncbi:hypothetical protein [Peterkaempfera bronchialis]|uniref:hypothetical protein n=1 Tax=Peterkaempfera bronchialis TaxID=2126346 RepID=UPI0013B435F4|nr:hypothetical protein [Peterkaempfera bronchialis]